MRRVVWEVRVELEVPDDTEPELTLDLHDGVLTVRVDRGAVTAADASPAQTTEEIELAVDAAVALLPDGELASVELELKKLRSGRKATIFRGFWVQRYFSARGDPREFAVYENGFPGPLVLCAEAALHIVRAEQRRKLSAARGTG